MKLVTQAGASKTTTAAPSAPTKNAPTAPRSNGAVTPKANGDSAKAANGTQTPPADASLPVSSTADPQALRQKLEQTRSKNPSSTGIVKEESAYASPKGVSLYGADIVLLALQRMLLHPQLPIRAARFRANLGRSLLELRQLSRPMDG